MRARDLDVAALLSMAALAGAAPRTYVVQEGDSQSSVAAAQDVVLAKLLELNGLAPDELLECGRLLILPDGPDAAANRAPTSYQVQAGDNLYSIAERLVVSVADLAELNQLDATSILQIGQVLKLPGGAASPPAEQEEEVAPAAAPEAPKVSLVLGPPPGKAAKAAAKLPDKVFISADRANIRTAASMEVDSLGTWSRGTRLGVVGKDGMWWKVELPGGKRTGYIAGWVVSDEPVAPDPDPEPTRTRSGDGDPLCYAYVSEPRINVRPRPGAEDERVAVAARGAKMAVLKVGDGWVQVRCDNGVTGWVARSLLRMPKIEDRPAARGLGDRLVLTAMAYLGTPYSRGGSSRGGVDCSGLVYMVCRANGISMPRTSRDQYGVGHRVSGGNLRPGDIVFFKDTYRSGISHVGIYIGDNKFVHAVRPGRGVSVTSLSDSYYASHWAGAYRVTD
ncbi:MAG: C40 family peptidase [Armatimonadetes bacterium]|nr:C40 family peptidase [Armatimonadota bacterium]